MHILLHCRRKLRLQRKKCKEFFRLSFVQSTAKIRTETSLSVILTFSHIRARFGISSLFGCTSNLAHEAITSIYGIAVHNKHFNRKVKKRYISIFIVSSLLQLHIQSEHTLKLRVCFLLFILPFILFLTK